jgi:hypothetical protein
MARGRELSRLAANSKHSNLVSWTLCSVSASAVTCVFDALWAVDRRAETQNRENNPMQSKNWGPQQRPGSSWPSWWTEIR